jgi:hypothetical protein
MIRLLQWTIIQLLAATSTNAAHFNPRRQKLQLSTNTGRSSIRWRQVREEPWLAVGSNWWATELILASCIWR